jgi:iron complex outermembrane receptor protein
MFQFTYFYQRGRAGINLCCALGVFYPVALFAQEIPVLPAVEVIAGEYAGAVMSTVETERAAQNLASGGVNLIEPQEIEGNRYTLRDLLDHQPGIVLLDFFGGADQPILSIRGSGIQSHPQSRGVLLLENGLPLNDADGSFRIGMLEARDARMITARRGANALHPAADTLGGELDSHSLTGHDEGDRLSLQAASFNTLLARAATGRQFERSDFHLSVSDSRSDGYRQHSDQRRAALRANFGTVISGAFENRTWISYTDQHFDIPGPLTLALALHNPTTNINHVMPMVRVTDPHRDTRQWRVANRSIVRAENLRHDFGVYYQNTDDLFVSPNTREQHDTRTLGLQYQIEGETGALAYGLGVFWSHSLADMRYRFNPNNPNPPIRTLRPTHYDARAQAFNAQWNGAWTFAENWRLTTLLRWVNAWRDMRSKENAERQEDRWQWLAPKIGVTWSPDADFRLFANVGAMREAPTFDQLARFSAPPPPPASMRLTPLAPQRAVSYEIGGRGRLADVLAWDVSLYHSRVRDELVEYSPDGISVYTFNYNGKTRHQGLELGVSGAYALRQGRILGRVSYTYSDFTFRDGIYRQNRIAGIPKHLLTAEAAYERGALKAGPHVRWVAGDTPTDHSNLAHYDGYAVLGFKLSYAPAKNLSFFLQGDNLTDKRYIASVSTPASANVVGAYYYPGNGRAFSGGVAYEF